MTSASPIAESSHRRGHWFDPSIAHQHKCHFLRSLKLPAEADRKPRSSPAFLVVMRTECSEDAVFAIAATGVEVQRGGGPLVAHHALDHVRRHAVIDQPG